jgi:surface-anchored protein
MASAQDEVIATGHYDLAITYEVESGWRAYIRDFDNGEDRPPLTTVWKVGESALRQVPNDPDFALLGNPGDSVWIIPELYNPEVVYLGMGAPLLGRNIFTGGLSNRGQVTLRLVSVEGSGPAAGGTFSIWQSGFPPRFYFSSADGIDETDALDAITANFHAHYNYGFSAPGIYRITFEYSGELVPELGGGDTSTTVTYTFDVGDTSEASPLRYAWPLEEGWAWSSWMGYHYAAFAPWILDFNHGWMYLPPAEPESLNLWTFEHGWLWTNQSFYPWLWDEAAGQWVLP